MDERERVYRQILTQRKVCAIQALFEYLFTLRHKRLPVYWEAKLGEALVRGELAVKKAPTETGLRWVHEVAAECQDALRTSEAVMVSAK